MDAEAVDVGSEVGEAIQGVLLPAPVVVASPVLDKALQYDGLAPQVQSSGGRRASSARSQQTIVQIVQRACATCIEKRSTLMISSHEVAGQRVCRRRDSPQRGGSRQCDRSTPITVRSPLTADRISVIKGAAAPSRVGSSPVAVSILDSSRSATSFS